MSPLTHIINSSLSENLFPIQWKKAKISRIPKSDDPQNFDDYRPASVLPLFSKVYERLVAKQLCKFLERSCTLKDTMAGFRKSHSTNTLSLKIRDDILRAISKAELTLSVYSSKAFDTVQYHTIIQKLHKIGFSASALKWFISYLGNRSQYVQVNDSKSATKTCQFGVPQGSVLGLLLFNLCVNDLQDIDPGDPVNTCQYADNTTQYKHFKILQVRQTLQNTQKRLDNLNVWSRKNNLLLNGAKTKYIIFSTTKIKQNFLQDLNIHSILTMIK